VLALVSSAGPIACASPPHAPEESRPAYVLYPAWPLEPRIQFLGTYSSDLDVLATPSRFQRFVVGERQHRELGKPYGAAIHDGEILVCDTRGGGIVIFDLKNGAVEVLGDRSPGKLGKPINLAVDEDGTRYVADVGLRRLMLYDRDNRFLRAIGEPELWKPSDVAIDGRRLYVTDVENGQVVVVDKASGEELDRFARRGAGKDELFLPTNLAVDEEGSVYVSDTGNFRVVKFDARGRLLQQFGSLGDSMGRFARPKGVAVDREGRAYVVDAAFENVQIFDAEGALLLFFGGPGNHPGGINLPADVSIDYANVELFSERVAPGYSIEYLILVTSQFGKNKVNVYGFLEPSEPSG
jgi:sugar lactone lactonase YvrE